MDPKKVQKASMERHVFVAPQPGRMLMRVALMISLLVLCVGAAFAIVERSVVTLVIPSVAAGCLVVLWAMLQTKIPQRITIEGAMVEIRLDGQTDRFDLEDPGVDIRVGDGEIAFAHYMDRWVVVRSRDVDWKVFSDVVMLYQNNADRYAEERDKRFGS
jgi:hypothetical protein